MENLYTVHVLIPTPRKSAKISMNKLIEHQGKLSDVMLRTNFQIWYST